MVNAMKQDQGGRPKYRWGLHYDRKTLKAYQLRKCLGRYGLTNVDAVTVPLHCIYATTFLVESWTKRCDTLIDGTTSDVEVDRGVAIRRTYT